MEMRRRRGPVAALGTGHGVRSMKGSSGRPGSTDRLVEYLRVSHGGQDGRRVNGGEQLLKTRVWGGGVVQVRCKGVARGV